jgi:hypothetical protein
MLLTKLGKAIAQLQSAHLTLPSNGVGLALGKSGGILTNAQMVGINTMTAATPAEMVTEFVQPWL